MTTDPRVDAYIAALRPDHRELLHNVRERVRTLVSDAQETICYGMPAFKLNQKFLLSYAGWKNHCSIYPWTDSLIDRHAEALRGYQRTKGSLHFTPERPLPEPALEDLVRSRIADLEVGGR
ncbi:MAG: DUF1801 domain-containing protein [Chloroflexota bacterium]|nr:DUF1801 domain-containing protein [Chloroflexota bacterium]